MTSAIVIRCFTQLAYIVNTQEIQDIKQDNGEREKGHTVEGLGSRILLISFFALEENHGGHVNSALNICSQIDSSCNPL